MTNIDLWEKQLGAPEFTPVPMLRARMDGWTRMRQRAFIAALCATGTVAAAARAAGMTAKSAYALRKRDGAESFAVAWDIAVCMGRDLMFDTMMERAVNGVTTIRLRLGGEVDIAHGSDKTLQASQMRGIEAERRRAGNARKFT
jgi:hypothetical protein